MCQAFRFEYVCAAKFVCTYHVPGEADVSRLSLRPDRASRSCSEDVVTMYLVNSEMVQCT